MTTELSTAHKYHLLLALCTTALFCAALSFTLSVGPATPLGATLALLTAAGGLAFTVNTVFWIILCSGGHSPFHSGGLDASEVKTVRSDAAEHANSIRREVTTLRTEVATLDRRMTDMRAALAYGVDRLLKELGGGEGRVVAMISPPPEAGTDCV